MFNHLHLVPGTEQVSSRGFLSDFQLMTYQDKFCFACCQFETENFSPELFQQLKVARHPSLSKAVNKRLAEFLAGRYLAQQVLAYMQAQNYQVGIGKHRCPIWPDGIVASISHHQQQAICVASDTLDYLGIDLENIMSSDTAQQVQSTVAGVDELALVTRAGLPQTVAVSLIFSAKESLFKAIYPRVGCYLDFDRSSLVHIDLVQQTLRLELSSEIQQQLGYHQHFICHFELQQEQLMTLIYA